MRKITAVRGQTKNPNRVNVNIDGKYELSLDISQVIDLGLKVGQELTDSDVDKLKGESEFGKIYLRALEYALMRPRSEKEVRDYLRRKLLSRPKAAVQIITQAVLDKLIEKGYVDDEKMAQFWVENRRAAKGTSARKLRAELAAKGIDPSVIDKTLGNSGRNDSAEIQKIIAKKFQRYPDQNKFAQYLMRQGFDYELAKEAIAQFLAEHKS